MSSSLKIGILTTNNILQKKLLARLKHIGGEIIFISDNEEEKINQLLDIALVDFDNKNLYAQFLNFTKKDIDKQPYSILLTSKEITENEQCNVYNNRINDIITFSDENLNLLEKKIKSLLHYLGKAEGNYAQKIYWFEKLEEQLKRSYMVTNEGYWDWNIKKDEYYFSPAYFTMLGYKPYEFKADFSSWKNMIHPDDRKQTLKTLRNYLSRKNRSFTLEFRMRAKNNDYYWVRSKGLSVEEDEKGRSTHFVGVHTNIHHEMLALMVLQESELKYKTLVEQVNDWIWETNEKAEYTYASPKIKDILGFSPKEVIGHTLYKFMPIEQATEIKKEFEEIAKQRKPFFQLINVSKHKNGQLRYIETSGTPIFDKTGKFKGYRGIDRDITERIKSERIIRESELKFRNLFNYLADSTIITDLQGEIHDVNKASIELLGKNAGELLKIDNIASFYPQNEIQLKNYLSEVLENGISSFESIIEKKNSPKIYLETKGKLINYKGKQALLHIARDISMRKDLEQRFLQVIIDTEEKERTRFAKDLHDGIGPQLSAIKLYVNSLGLDQYSIEKKRIMIDNTKDIIDKAIISAKEIANNLMPSVLSNFGLIDALKQFCDDINKTEVIKIDLQIRKNFSRLESGKEIALYRVICELINNTVRHAQASNINLIIAGGENTIEIEYKDNGIGFQPREDTKKDTGLGLKNIASRIKSINGIFAFETAPGKGYRANIKVME